MKKGFKTALVALPLVAAGDLFWVVCGQVGGAYRLILSPSQQALGLLVWFLVALCALLIAAGLAAALVRPLGIGMGTMLLSGLTIVFHFPATWSSAALLLVYLLAGVFYLVGVAGELRERIRFSVRPISQAQGVLLMGLVLVACGNLYLGYADQIRREGFTLPEAYVERFMEQMEKQILERVPEAEREQAVAEFRREFRAMVDGLVQRTVKPYQRYIPAIVAVGLFMSVVTIARLVVWAPLLILSAAIPTLTWLGISETVVETGEIERLVIR